jgi:DNA polymerase I-like protein with 3'-5' exonuclease and polymerase domains
MANRRAINTPIQGGAADIVNASMVKIAQNQRLK